MMEALVLITPKRVFMLPATATAPHLASCPHQPVSVPPPLLTSYKLCPSYLKYLQPKEGILDFFRSGDILHFYKKPWGQDQFYRMFLASLPFNCESSHGVRS